MTCALRRRFLDSKHFQEGKGIFVCGRPKSDAHVEAEGRPTLLSMRCSQCDKGKHIKSTAQLVHELDLKRQKRF